MMSLWFIPFGMMNTNEPAHLCHLVHRQCACHLEHRMARLSYLERAASGYGGQIVHQLAAGDQYPALLARLKEALRGLFS